MRASSALGALVASHIPAAVSAQASAYGYVLIYLVAKDALTDGLH